MWTLSDLGKFRGAQYKVIWDWYRGIKWCKVDNIELDIWGSPIFSTSLLFFRYPFESADILIWPWYRRINLLWSTVIYPPMISLKSHLINSEPLFITPEQRIELAIGGVGDSVPILGLDLVFEFWISVISQDLPNSPYFFLIS